MRVAAKISVSVITFCCVLPSAAVSQDIEQLFQGTMNALNQLSNTPTPSENTEPQNLSNTSALEITDFASGTNNIEQSGLNAANLVQTEHGLRNVNQVMDGAQLVSNDLSLQPQGRANIKQVGENLTNLVIADSVDSVDQMLGSGASQTILNTAQISGSVGMLGQVGRNTANVVYADISIGSGSQVIPEDVTQKVENVIDLRDGQTLSGMRQTGVNIGNVLIAGHVEGVSRTFNGTQTIENTVYLAEGELRRPIYQSGINIANFVSAKSVNNLSQISNGIQDVSNKVISPTLEELTEETGMITTVSQNYVNVLNITTDLTTGETPGSTVASQLANYNQNVSASGSHTQVGNAASVER